MKFERRFQVRAPIEAVAEFHRHAEGLKLLTPPVAFMRFHQLPDPIQQGDTLSFTMWLGPIPVYWESCFPEMSATGFVDTQGRGPFRFWKHQHRFTVIEPLMTEVNDRIEATLRHHPWHGIIGLLIWLSLPILFWYRQRQTRRLLETEPR